MMTRSLKRRHWTAAALLLLLLLGIATMTWYRRPDALLAQATALRDGLSGTAAASSSPRRRQRQLQQLQRAIGQLAPEQRKTFWADRRRQFRDWLNDFFRSPRQEQVARLDAEIDRMDAFRCQGGTGWATELSAKELQQRQKQWLDLTTAEERALVDLYFQMLAERQQQRGSSIPSSPWSDAPT
jgi:hypothetical protein